MDLRGNTLDDFPSDEFSLLVFCGACGRERALDRSTLSGSLLVSDLVLGLRCARCGGRETSLRIVYIGAGAFAYGTN